MAVRYGEPESSMTVSGAGPVGSPAPPDGAPPAPVPSGAADASPLDRTLESPDATDAALAAGLATTNVPSSSTAGFFTVSRYVPGTSSSTAGAGTATSVSVPPGSTATAYPSTVTCGSSPKPPPGIVTTT